MIRAHSMQCSVFPAQELLTSGQFWLLAGAQELLRLAEPIVRNIAPWCYNPFK
jgi:hypothetical protein